MCGKLHWNANFQFNWCFLATKLHQQTAKTAVGDKRFFYFLPRSTIQRMIFVKLLVFTVYELFVQYSNNNDGRIYLNIFLFYFFWCFIVLFFLVVIIIVIFILIIFAGIIIVVVMLITLNNAFYLTFSFLCCFCISLHLKPPKFCFCVNLLDWRTNKKKYSSFC